MPKKRVFLHARRRVAKTFLAPDLDRLLGEAVAQAEGLENWGPGEEHVYQIEDEPYFVDGIECSSFTVCHMGSRYEVYFYHGMSGQLYT